MESLELKYGCNPNQGNAEIFMSDGSELPIELLNGNPSYINILDALNAWQLVKELKEATEKPSATSFKHVSPAGAAIAETLSLAYQKARGCDPDASFGDFVALSDICDIETAEYLKTVVSDGIIAPGYDDEALEILKTKKKGGYVIIQIDPSYHPESIEQRDVFGITVQQKRNDIEITEDTINNGEIATRNKEIPDSIKLDMIIGMITLKYTQSNSVAYVYEGVVIAIGAGQQSRIACTKLAGDKADAWFRNTGQVQKKGLAIGDVVVVSDAFFPFADNIERAHKSGVGYIAQTGGSIRDDKIVEACDKHNLAMVFTGVRLFHH